MIHGMAFRPTVRRLADEDRNAYIMWYLGPHPAEAGEDRNAYASMHYTKVVFDFLLDIVFPRFCVSCGKMGKYLCPNCLGKIEFFRFEVCPYCELQSPYGLTHPRCQKSKGIDGMFVLAHYRGPIRKAIQTIKYQGGFVVCEELSGLISEKFHQKFDFDFFVPVPLSKKRLHDRGFNQAEKLANNLSGANAILKKPVANLLIRTKDTKPQFDLDYEDRKHNVKDAFMISPGTHGPISKTSICLVDDVATTGSTIFECAKALKLAGAKKVYAICVARGG